MRERDLYAGLAGGTLAIAVGSAGLAGTGAVLGDLLATAAAAMCAALLAIPGLLFLRRVRQIQAQEAALAYVGGVGVRRGVLRPAELAEEFDISSQDAAKILRKAVLEGYADGDLDDRGTFIAGMAPRCPSCGTRVSREMRGACPACGARTGG